MVVVPLASSGNEPAASPAGTRKCDSMVWVRVAAAGSLATAGVLLMAGKRRAGLVMAAAGTSLTMLDQQETVRLWWNQVPGYMTEIQSVLTRVQGAVDEISAQGERLRSILSR